MNDACTYRSDLYYVNRSVDSRRGLRSEKVVGRLEFYLTMIGWFLSGKRFRTFKEFKVLTQE